MEKLLFSELRLLKSNLKGVAELNEEGVKLALVDIKNLEALGFKLDSDVNKNPSFLLLASEYSENPKMTPLYKRVKSFEPKIKVSPMYPNFPIEVLEMTEEEFRRDQSLHYLSTYGLEGMFGIEVSKGWLPHNEVKESSDENKKTSKQIIKLKTIEYLTEDEIKEVIAQRLLGKKERLEERELEIAKNFVDNLPRKAVTEIPFKENIVALYKDFFNVNVNELSNEEYEVREFALNELKNGVLKHPGDVLDLLEAVVVGNSYKHLKTSTKRAFVNLLESFPVESLEENLAEHRWSNNFLGKGGKRRSMNRSISLLGYISYSRFSKSKAHLDVVENLRGGKLTSWNQDLERAYSKQDKTKVLRKLEERPGIFFRQLNRLFKNGYSLEEVSEAMKGKGADLKTQSIVSALNNYEGEIADTSRMFIKALGENLASKNIDEIKGKKVFIDQSEFDFSNSKIELTDKSDEGGYIQSGLAFKLPEGVDIIRFFTYWNDKRRIDIDLHAGVIDKDGNKSHIGWNGYHNHKGIYVSGDITHSDAAEYIDIDIEKSLAEGVRHVQFNINSYTGVPFNEIETLFTGVQAVSKLAEGMDESYDTLHDPKNSFFRHDLKAEYSQVDYAFIDLEKRLLIILAKSDKYSQHDWSRVSERIVNLPLDTYLQILCFSQDATLVEDKENAEVILGLPKSKDENYISLIDNNYFMDR